MRVEGFVTISVLGVPYTTAFAQGAGSAAEEEAAGEDTWWEYLTDLVLAEEEAKPDCPDPASEMQVRSDPIREPYKSNAGPLKLPFGPS